MSTLRNFLESESFFRIPLKKLNTGHYKLEARVNGKKGYFILDTGASSSCIDIQWAPYFKMISEHSDVKAAGAGAINMKTLAAHGNKFKIEKKIVSNMSFVLFDLHHVNEALSQVDEDGVQGILGADFLKQWRAVIDYGRNALYIK